MAIISCFSAFRATTYRSAKKSQHLHPEGVINDPSAPMLVIKHPEITFPGGLSGIKERMAAMGHVSMRLQDRADGPSFDGSPSKHQDDQWSTLQSSYTSDDTNLSRCTTSLNSPISNTTSLNSPISGDSQFRSAISRLLSTLSIESSEFRSDGPWTGGSPSTHQYGKRISPSSSSRTSHDTNLSQSCTTPLMGSPSPGDVVAQVAAVDMDGSQFRRAISRLISTQSIEPSEMRESLAGSREEPTSGSTQQNMLLFLGNKKKLSFDVESTTPTSTDLALPGLDISSQPLAAVMCGDAYVKYLDVTLDKSLENASNIVWNGSSSNVLMALSNDPLNPKP